MLFVGRLSAEKGIEVFLDALPLLRAQSWRAVVIGEGPLEAPAKQRVVQEGLADRVRFAGWLSGADLDREYERAAVLAVPSTVKEAFGLVGIEAMAFGKPVVAFDAGGIREWLQDGKTGYLVRQGIRPIWLRGSTRCCSIRSGLGPWGRRGNDWWRNVSA
ncbi:MAG: glycosyltransferase [Nitrospiraceae bacterium]